MFFYLLDCAASACNGGNQHENKPVCGLHYRTYTNECQLAIADCKNKDTKITVAYSGECKGAHNFLFRHFLYKDDWYFPPSAMHLYTIFILQMPVPQTHVRMEEPAHVRTEYLAWQRELKHNATAQTGFMAQCVNWVW